MNATLSPVSLVASQALLVLMLYVLGDLSRIFGVALKKKKLYRGLFVSGAGVVVSTLMMLFSQRLMVAALAVNVLALLFAVGVAFYYWHWLLGDLTRR